MSDLQRCVAVQQPDTEDQAITDAIAEGDELLRRMYAAQAQADSAQHDAATAR